MSHLVTPARLGPERPLASSSADSHMRSASKLIDEVGYLFVVFVVHLLIVHYNRECSRTMSYGNSTTVQELTLGDLERHYQPLT